MIFAPRPRACSQASGRISGGVDDGAEAFGRGNRLKAADTRADNQNIGRL